MAASSASPSASAMQAVRDGDYARAESIIRRLIGDVFPLSVDAVTIARDRYSLNSVNGFVQTGGGHEYFFKFHHEEGEERTLEEFYRGELLKAAGYPVDVPVFVSRTLGSQVLLYERRASRRVSDLCEQLDVETPGAAQSLRDAQSRLDALTIDIYARTWHRVSPAQAAAEPINQLFHHRLVDPGRPDEAGGRARRFFWDRSFDLPGLSIPAEALRAATWVVNGVAYRDCIDTLLTRSRTLLSPGRLAQYGGVTAHGDSHNANIWWDVEPPGGPRMVFFDPAFAGDHISALLAEVKATFHNIFAHPLWLYHPDLATQTYRATAQRHGDRIEIDTDWALSALRADFLAIKAVRLWKPLLARLHEQGVLGAEWRATLRCALFCCPTLVMDLCAGGAGGHTSTSSAIGIAMAVMAGSEPEAGRNDVVTRFLDSITPAGTGSYQNL